MTKVNQLMVSMQRGEVTPYAHARIDLEDYRHGLKTCQNFLVLPYGGVTRVPGTFDAGPAGDEVTSVEARVMPFIFSQTDAYAIEFSNFKIRFHLSTGVVGGGTPYEVAAPYVLADIWNIQITSIGDVVYIACKGYAPRTLTRTADDNWALAVYTPEGGPWLPIESTVDTVLTPDGTGHAIPLMTSLTAPSGTVSSDPTHSDAWELFDRDLGTAAEPGTGGDGWIQYDYGVGVEKIIISYLLTAPQGTTSTEQMPTAWSIEGQEDGGSDWVILDVQSGHAAWVPGEVRYYEINNTVAYRKLRIVWRDGGTRDDGSAVLAGWEPLLDPTDQTAFNLVASAVDGINDGAGFATTDVGRLIRFLPEDGLWRILQIIARSSTTAITVKVLGPAPLPGSDKAASYWQMQAWGTVPGWPENVTKFKGRIAMLSTTTEPRTGWLSVSADYDNMGVSQPVIDDDAITFTLVNGDVDDILWATSRGDVLVVGTVGDVRVVGKRDTTQPFSPSNHDDKDSIKTPPGAVPPVWIGNTLLFVNKQRNRVHETAFSEEQGGYVEAELTLLAEHLFRTGIKEMHYQKSPLSTLWVVMDTGVLVACTYNKQNGIFAVSSIVMPGVSVEVLSMCVIPDTEYDMPILVTKRSVNEAWSYRIERMIDPFKSGGGSSWEWPLYLMGGVLYNGGTTSTLSGLDHFEGETVGVFDLAGADLGDAVVTSGAVTVPGGASVTDAFTGLRYTSEIVLLRPPNVKEDGSWLYDYMLPISCAVDVLETYGLYGGGSDYTHALTTEDDHATSPGEPVLHTGMLEVPLEEGWNVDQSDIKVTTDRAYSATIRAVSVKFERGQ